MRFLPAAANIISPSFFEDAFDISVLTALTGRDLHQLERHIFGKTAQILAKAGLYPVRHFGANGHQLQLHALTPEFFQLVQTTALFLHDVDHHVAEVDDDPVGGGFPSTPSGSMPAARDS